ncbi:MAG: hypothetical protein U0Q22_16935 [Acidimicrobiales bacterium]
MADHRRRRSLAIGVLLAAAVVAAPACSSTRDLDSADQTGTTIRKLADDLVDEDPLTGGSAGAKELKKIIDRLVASNDPCAILTQKDIKGYQLDPTTLASSSARQTLAQGVVDVYDHLIKIVPDTTITPALQKQRDTFVQVLGIIDRYAANPTSKQSNDQIQALLTGTDFVQAQNAVSTWTYTNCG